MSVSKEMDEREGEYREIYCEWGGRGDVHFRVSRTYIGIRVCVPARFLRRRHSTADKVCEIKPSSSPSSIYNIISF